MYDYLFAFISRTSLKMSSRSYFSRRFRRGRLCLHCLCSRLRGICRALLHEASAQGAAGFAALGAALCRGARFTEVCTAARHSTFCGCMETGVSGMMGRSAVYSADTGITCSSPVSLSGSKDVGTRGSVSRRACICSRRMRSSSRLLRLRRSSCSISSSTSARSASPLSRLRLARCHKMMLTTPPTPSTMHTAPAMNSVHGRRRYRPSAH